MLKIGAERISCGSTWRTAWVPSRLRFVRRGQPGGSQRSQSDSRVRPISRPLLVILDFSRLFHSSSARAPQKRSVFSLTDPDYSVSMRSGSEAATAQTNLECVGDRTQGHFVGAAPAVYAQDLDRSSRGSLVRFWGAPLRQKLPKTEKIARHERRPSLNTSVPFRTSRLVPRANSGNPRVRVRSRAPWVWSRVSDRPCLPAWLPTQRYSRSHAESLGYLVHPSMTHPWPPEHHRTPRPHLSETP